MEMEPVLELWGAFKGALTGVWDAVCSLIQIFIPLQSGQEGVNEAFGAGEVVGLALAWVFQGILATATMVVKGVEAVVIVVASLIDAVVTLVMSLYHLATGNVKAAGADWSSFSDRFWQRLETSSMNPDRPAQEAARAGVPALGLQKAMGPAAKALPNLQGQTSGAVPGGDGPGLPKLLAAAHEPGPVSITYSPKVELKGTAGPEDEARIMAVLHQHGDDLADLIQQRFDRKLRWNGAH